LYKNNLDEAGVEDFLAKARVPKSEIKTSEDVVLNSVGVELCELFFRGYTKKQWGLDLSELSAGVAARIPTRSNDDDRYFTDTFQFMPADGYTKMFNRILDHENIQVRVGIDYHTTEKDINYKKLIYTGPIDEYFNFKLGNSLIEVFVSSMSTWMKKTSNL